MTSHARSPGPVLGYDVTARSSAPPDAVFRLLEDGAGWSRWAGPMVRWSSWETPTPAPGPAGTVGWVRLLGTKLVHSREEIVAHDPPRLLAYEVRSGWPVRRYRAEVRLTPDAAGTRIDWSGRFEPVVPGTGAVLLSLTRRMVAGFARRLAATATGAASAAAESDIGPRRRRR
ncbi:MAG TPA: SRPBCC family protein [Acidimicrobiales bacterium]|nr:SRPBCC family protein [Acidimicrobiales bacterium]